MRTSVGRALRHAVLVSLAAAPAAACGGSVTIAGGSGSPSGSSTGDSGTTRGSSGAGASGGSTGGSGASSGYGATGSAGSGASSTGTTPGSGSSSSGSAASGREMDAGATGQCAVKVNSASGNTVCSTTFDLVGPASACGPAYDAGFIIGLLPNAKCAELCPPRADGGLVGSSTVTYCSVYEDAAGGHVNCSYCLFTGRRPEGLSGDAADGPDAVARFLSHAAYLEAASVDAFVRLGRELKTHGAPRSLCAAARRAARDEVRHARVTQQLAERAGASVLAVRSQARGNRSLEAMAVENAVEGCVRETLGAAVAMIQAERAGDRHVRRAMKRIARDETRHAELSWAVARWLDTKLDAPARVRVRQTRDQAVRELLCELARDPDTVLIALLGIPPAAQARAVVEDLRESLWS